ncbi:MAG: DNA repair protein RecO [Nitrospiraceae bacterium]
MPRSNLAKLAMPLLKTSAVTLKSRKWGEADRIVTFYTLRYGKLRGVARGARRIKSRFGGTLEPFVYCDLNLFEKRNDPLYRITQVDIRETFPQLRESLALMAAAARMVNLVSAVTAEGDPSPGIFETLAGGLRSLQDNNDPLLTTLLFQIRLLGQTGFRPVTDHCATCGATRGIRLAQFSPVSGGVVCSPCGSRRPDRCLSLSPGSLAFLQQALHLPTSVLTRLRASGQVRAEVEAVIESYVTVVAGKRLPPVDFLAAEGKEPVYGLTRSPQVSL